MGLLDNYLNSDEGRLTLGLLAAAGPTTDPNKTGFGARMQTALDSVDQWKQQQALAKRQAMQDQFMQMQMEQAKAQAADQAALRQAASSANFTPQQAENASMGPMPDGSAVPEVKPGFNHQAYISSLYGMGLPDKAMAHEMAIAKDDAPVKLDPGGILLSGRASGYKPLFTAPPKPEAKPAALQEYEFAKAQGYTGSFLDFQIAQKKAGATNVALKVDNKTGESLAGQVGPMAKDSRIQTQGAVKMYDAADRLEKAIDSNKVTSGPLASQIQTVKQLVQVIGGGNDEGIRQTRQAIKSLAQMSVEARKQLQGQGQVTESEAAAVAKADAGDINDLTTGELRDLVTLTKRAAHFQAKSHQELIGTLGGKDETKSLVPFYNVQGLDPLLNHKPTLPQIGGNGWSIKPVGQ